MGSHKPGATMDQESFEKTVSQFKKSVKDIGKKETLDPKEKQLKAQTPFREPKIHDPFDVQDIPVNSKSSQKNIENDLSEEQEPKRANLLVVFSIAAVLGLVLGIIFAALLVSGNLDLPLKDVKQVFKTITALGSHLH